MACVPQLAQMPLTPLIPRRNDDAVYYYISDRHRLSFPEYTNQGLSSVSLPAPVSRQYSTNHHQRRSQPSSPSPRGSRGHNDDDVYYYIGARLPLEGETEKGGVCTKGHVNKAAGSPDSRRPARLECRETSTPALSSAFQNRILVGFSLARSGRADPGHT